MYGNNQKLIVLNTIFRYESCSPIIGLNLHAQFMHDEEVNSYTNFMIQWTRRLYSRWNLDINEFIYLFVSFFLFNA